VSQGLQAVLKSGALQEGLCAVQDEGAGLVVALMDPQPGEALLDACAAPGGKTVFAALRMQAGAEASSIVAVDVNEARLGLVAGAAERAGVSEMVSTVTADLCAAATPRCGAAAWDAIGASSARRTADPQRTQRVRGAARRHRRTHGDVRGARHQHLGARAAREGGVRRDAAPV